MANANPPSPSRPHHLCQLDKPLSRYLTLRYEHSFNATHQPGFFGAVLSFFDEFIPRTKEVVVTVVVGFSRTE